MATENKDFKVKNGLQVAEGGTFGAPVTVGYPTSNSHAATKQYVDENAGGSGGGPAPSISETFPEDPTIGRLWLDSVTGRLYIYYVDSTEPASSQWIELTYGSTGPSGAQGATGPAGPANTLTIGEVSSGPADASITGTAPNQVLNLVIPTGEAGPEGPANVLTIGSVVSGETASAEITGTAPNQVLNLVLPQGDTGATGPANTLSLGSVVTGEPGTEAQAIIGGTAPNQTLSFIIPRGEQGLQGLQGIQGEIGDFPDQTDNGGKVLTTDGTDPSWSDELSGPLAAQSFRPTSSTAPANGMYLGATNQLNFATNSTSRVTIGATGDLTVGASIVGQRFRPTVSTAPSVGMYSSATNILDFATNSTKRFTIDASGNASFTGSLTALPSFGTTTNAATNVGFMGIPSADDYTTNPYNFTAELAGRHIYSPTSRTVNIPAGMPIGTTFVFISGPGATTTININGGETLRLVGTGTAGSRTLAQHGIATAVKVVESGIAASNLWYISGNGLT